MEKDALKKLMQKQEIRRLGGSNRFPSYPQMAKNLGRDVVRTVRSIAAGENIKADDSEVQKRMAICRGCEFFDPPQERCTKCGCYMSIKTYLKASSCPIHKW